METSKVRCLGHNFPSLHRNTLSSTQYTTILKFRHRFRLPRLLLDYRHPPSRQPARTQHYPICWEQGFILPSIYQSRNHFTRALHSRDNNHWILDWSFFHNSGVLLGYWISCCCFWFDNGFFSLRDRRPTFGSLGDTYIIRCLWG